MSSLLWLLYQYYFSKLHRLMKNEFWWNWAKVVVINQGMLASMGPESIRLTLGISWTPKERIQLNTLYLSISSGASCDTAVGEKPEVHAWPLCAFLISYTFSYSLTAWKGFIPTLSASGRTKIPRSYVVWGKRKSQDNLLTSGSKRLRNCHGHSTKNDH